jgi:uncharacterized protein (TIGR02453 family)
MFPGFSPAAIQFLQALKRNNKREWFQPRKETFDREVHAPMAALVEAINAELLDFAPEHATEPKRAIFRIYRDTRFSNDKTPYKTHIAAWFRRSGYHDKSAAGFYFHVSAEQVYVAGGCYMPPADQLLAIRKHMADHHERYRKLAGDKTLKKLVTERELSALSRDPKGFPKDHPAADLIRAKQWGFGQPLPVKVATTKKLLPEIVKRFRALTPVVNFLNEPFVAPKPRREIFFE